MTMRDTQEFKQWFHRATWYEPYPYQVRFACEQTLPELVDVSTGMGENCNGVLGWLWPGSHDDCDIAVVVMQYKLIGA